MTQIDMTPSLWPRFASHDEASCFNCGGDFGPDPYWRASGHEHGNGAFEVACEKCRMLTYYDIEEGER